MAELKFCARSSDLIDEYNSLIYIINSVVKKVSTMELVRVLSVNTENKTISAIPIIKEANASGEAIEESPIDGVRYFQWQFGGNAIKGTPQVGDIGMIVICKKDISSPESGIIQTYREYCLSDSIYIGGICGLNQEPTNTIEFNDTNITINSQEVIINASTSQVNGQLSVLCGASGTVYTGTGVLTFKDGILTSIQ